MFIEQMFPRDRVCPFHCYPYTASSVVASFPPPRYLVSSFSFPFLFQFSPPHLLSLLDATQHKRKTSMMHVLWALPYFGINWYWFNPEIRNWLIFNSISFAPKLTNCFQACNMLVPKAHGQTSPTQATQYTPRVQQYSLVSFFSFPNFTLGCKVERKRISWMLAFRLHLFLLQSSGQNNILYFPVFQERLVQAWAKRLRFYCFSYPSQAACIDLHPYVLQGIDLRTLYSLASYLGSSASELAALLQNEAQVQTSTYDAWKIDNPSGETKKKPSDRVNALFRACCRSCRSRDEQRWEGWTSVTAECVCSQHPGVPGAHGRVQQDPIACKGDMPWAMQQFTPNLPALSLAQTWYRKPFHFPQPQTSLLRSKTKSWFLLSSPWRSAPEKRCCMSVWSWKWRRENTKHSSGYYHLLRLGRKSPGPTTGIQHVCGQKAAVGVSAQHPVELLKCWPFYLLLIFKYSDKRANVLASLLQTLSPRYCF